MAEKMSHESTQEESVPPPSSLAPPTGTGYEWGENLVQAFEQCGLGLYGYMTDLGTVEEDPELTQVFDAEGHDMQSLLYAYLEELLFHFSAENFIGKEIHIDELNKETFKIRMTVRGEQFDLDKHPQGTEVKAITYSNMQILEPDPKHAEIYVIIDI
eukprot:gnl/Hemi2/9746_TR3391_c0_g1_i1.p1 gnl/Hemi2/9746_TR3391_c0_g1~~gnl/Hemi2/9746_TR3391_c0_g1_i1.p1  ORF type:complete len:157 (-),score=43.42 gnl/Hemi2/9746_TR3391_c0_g1_i1:192-662(-)